MLKHQMMVHMIHLLVYDINEKQHNDLADLRKIGIKETCEYTKRNDITSSWALSKPESS